MHIIFYDRWNILCSILFQCSRQGGTKLIPTDDYSFIRVTVPSLEPRCRNILVEKPAWCTYLLHVIVRFNHVSSRTNWKRLLHENDKWTTICHRGTITIVRFSSFLRFTYLFIYFPIVTLTFEIELHIDEFRLDLDDFLQRWSSLPL